MAATRSKTTKSAKTGKPVKKTKPATSSKPVSKKVKSATGTLRTPSVLSAQVRKLKQFFTRQTTGRKGLKAPAIRLRKTHLLWLGIGLVVIVVLYALRSVFVVATVNGQPVSRFALIQELERTSGRQALNQLVVKTLVLQEARKQNVSISDQEVNDEIKRIEDNLKTQGQSLEQVLTLQGLTREQLIEQIRLQKLVEKMVGEDVTVSDKEVQDYMAQNAENLPEGTKPEDVKEQLHSQKLSEKVQAWIDELQQKAQINYLK